MTSGDHDTLEALAAPYVLGALSDDEREAFAAHLSTCRACQQEVATMSRVVEGIPQTLDRATLPPGLKSRVLAAATTAKQDEALRHPPPRSDPSCWVGWLAAAASIAALAMGLLAWSGWAQTARLQQQLAVVQRREAALDAQLASLRASAAGAQQTDAVLRASDLSRVDLAGQTGAPVASGRVLWSATAGLVFVAANLPPLPAGRVYQLWVVADKPLSAGVVTPDGAGRLTVTSDQPVAGRPKAFALTLEPEGGRPAPTGPMLLVGSSE